MSIYSAHTWRRDTKHWFTTHPNTTCACGCGDPATERDHRVPRRMLLALGIHNPDHPRWLQPLTHACHSRKTRTIDVPLLKRWQAGEDVQQLAEEAMRATAGVG